MFLKIWLDVDEKSCLFQEGGHLGPNLPPLDPVSPHFSPPVGIQRHHLAGFMTSIDVVECRQEGRHGNKSYIHLYIFLKCQPFCKRVYIHLILIGNRT